MLKIVEARPCDNPQGEYVVAQNLGLVTVGLRGWALCTDAYLDGSPQQTMGGMYIFHQDVPISPYMRVVLFTGSGEDGWVPTIDGKQAYCVFWNRTQSVWTESGSIYVLQIAASKRLAAPDIEAARSEGCSNRAASALQATPMGVRQLNANA